MVQRGPYFAAGGHAAIQNTMHDGLLLPRVLRKAGFRTDLADMTHLATCRMYTGARQVWSGLTKNATEGLAAPARIVPVTLLLILGQVTPLVLMMWVWGRGNHSIAVIAFALVGLIGSWSPRFLAARRFQQDWRSAALNPIGILLLVVLQWYALIAKMLGRKPIWKERICDAG
jgi:hypothetical protein